jgi:hypothetical protein
MAASPWSFGTHQVLAIAQWTETSGPLTVLALEGDASRCCWIPQPGQQPLLNGMPVFISLKWISLFSRQMVPF